MMLVEEFNTAAAALAHLAPDMGAVSRRLEEMRSGYPASTVGASNTGSGALPPPPDDDDDPEGGPVNLTRTERAGIDRAEGRDRVALDAMEIRELLTTLIATTHRLDILIAPYRMPAQSARTQALDTAPQDWCTSCYRDGQHHEPVGRKPNGTVYHDSLCRWCGDFRTEHGQLPSLPLLRARHEGRRITVQMVEKSTRRKP